MTEAEWWACTDPDAIPWHRLYGSPLGERKRRLFECACCRRVWHEFTDPRSRAAIETAERFADGLVSDPEREQAENAAFDVWKEPVENPAFEWEVEPLPFCMAAFNAVVHLSDWGGAAAYDAPSRIIRQILPSEAAGQLDLLRDVYGPLLFRPVPVAESWRTATVRALAETIYSEEAFDRLPILADALEEAGCDDPDILSHCRGDGPHVRGCWVIDLLTGRG